MNLSIICAVGYKNLIGNQSKLPWIIKEDLKYFRYLTLGKTIVMGRVTFSSIGKFLVDRKNIILTKKKKYKVNNCIIVNSPKDSIRNIFPYNECIIIGGFYMYNIFHKYCNYMYITKIYGKHCGNKHFPGINMKDWILVSYINRNNYQYVLYKRNTKNIKF